jgi:hypothetical protein
MLTNVSQSFVKGHTRKLTNRYRQSSGPTNSGSTMGNHRFAATQSINDTLIQRQNFFERWR